MSGLRLAGRAVLFGRAAGAFALAATILLAVALPLSAQSPEGQLWEKDAASRVQAVALSEDGNRVVVGRRDNSLRLFDGSGEMLWPFEAGNSILGLDISPDGQWLAVASEDRFVYLLDGEGNELWKFKAARPMNNAAVAGDGSLVAATSDDLSVYVFDNQGNLLWQEELGIGVRAVDVYGSGEKARVVLGSDDGLITIYNRDGRDLLRAWLDYSVVSVSVTPNGARILAGAGDGSAILLNGSNGNQIWSFRAEDTVKSVSLASNGASALVGSEDGSAYLLDGDGMLMHRFRQESEVLSVGLSGDGSRLSIGTVSGAARVYDRAAALRGAARSSAQRQRTLIAVVGVIALLLLAAVWAARNTAAGQQVWQRSAAGPLGVMQTMWSARLSYLLILPTLALLLTFNYYPAFSGLYHAFTEWSPGVRTEWVGLANFQSLLENRFFLSGFRNAAILVVVSIAKTMTMPLLVAEFIFNLRNRFSQYWFRTLFVVPIVLPAVVEILVWNNIYDPAIGLLNESLKLVGLEQLTRVWYGDASVALGSIIFIGVPWVNAFALLIFYGGLISISNEIIDASRVDGASTWRRFWSIDLPLLMGQVKLLLILNFINAVQTFELVFLTTGGGPGASTYTPALELYYKAMRMDRMGIASAIGMILFFIILAGTIINMRFVSSSTEYEA
ncbi:MAG: PQQ-binding-like beta-propeller repeat protein [Caldilineaceae bacterium]|nr:PQQ-binding-like beta-propeller repeat protein [Caldilineaceae bacterium]